VCAVVIGDGQVNAIMDVLHPLHAVAQGQGDMGHAGNQLAQQALQGRLVEHHRGMVAQRVGWGDGRHAFDELAIHAIKL
jgi:hypothetical protein